ncbi:MAG: WG repeat-containing protein [Saprospiraceae bacterium]
MRILVFFIFMLGCTISGEAQSYFPIKVNKKWGLMKANGSIFLPASYDAIGEFQRFGYAIIQRNGKVGLLNQAGKEIIAPYYDDLQVLDSNLIAVMDQAAWQVINLAGEIILAKGYERARVWEGGFISFRKNRRWGLANQAGNIICPTVYDGMELLHLGFFKTRKGDQYGLIDVQGKEILPCAYEAIEYDQEQLFFFKKEKYWGAVNAKGKLLIKAQFNSFQRLSKDFLQLFRKKKKYLYGTRAGRVLTKGEFDHFYNFSPAGVLCKKNRKLGLLNSDGRLCLPVEYDEIQDCGAGFFRVRKEGQWGVVNAQHEFVIPSTYDYIAPVNHQLCMVKKEAHFGLLNFAGDVLVPVAYDRIVFEDQRVKAYQGERLQVFYFDEKGDLRKEQDLQNHFSIRIAGTASTRTSFVADTTPVMKKFEWFYAPQSDKWGLRRLDNGVVQIKPSFDQVIPMPAYGLTIVGIEKLNAIDFDRTTFRFEMVYGVVNHEIGKLVTKVNLLDIRLTDFEKGHPTARIIFETGRHGLMTRHPIGKIVQKDFAYIGAFKDGLARMSIRGKLAGSLNAKQYGLEKLEDYLNEILSANYRVDYTLHDRFFARDAKLTCVDCSFGYLDTSGKIIIPTEYRFARDFVNEIGIVAQAGKWGVRGKQNETILPCTYDGISFLENTKQQILKLDQQHKRYGLLDTLGNMRIKLLYDEIDQFSENLLAVKKQGLWGFVDQRGKLIVPCQYRAVRAFQEGFAAVKKSNKWGVIDRTGRIWIDFEYTRIGDMQEGLIWAQLPGKVRYFDTQGNVIIRRDFERATNFSGGVARVYQDGKYGLIDSQGAFVLRPKYSHIAPFNTQGLAVVRYGKERIRYGLINREGELVTRRDFKKIRGFKEGLAAVKYRDGYGFINEQGDLVIPPIYTRVSDFSEGRATVQRKGKCGYIDQMGEEVIRLDFSKCLDFTDGKAVVYKGYRKGGIIDRNGAYIIEPEVNRLLEFSDGRGLVRNPNYQFYYITDEAKQHQATTYQQAGKFQHGVAAVQMNNRWGIINQKGITIVPPKFDEIAIFQNGYAKVAMKQFSGLSNLRGEIIVPTNFEYISYAGEGLFRVEQGDKMGYFDFNGKWVWSLQQ